MKDNSPTMGEIPRYTEKTSGGTVTIAAQATSKEAADHFKEWYLGRYHPNGYGTSLSIQEKDGEWLITGTRYSSCD